MVRILQGQQRHQDRNKEAELLQLVGGLQNDKACLTAENNNLQQLVVRFVTNQVPQLWLCVQAISDRVCNPGYINLQLTEKLGQYGKPACALN